MLTSLTNYLPQIYKKSTPKKHFFYKKFPEFYHILNKKQTYGSMALS